MPEIFVDDSNFKSYKQCEIRQATPRGYFFDILWIPVALAKKGNLIRDNRGVWTVHEVHGTKKMPSPRGGFTQDDTR